MTIRPSRIAAAGLAAALVAGASGVAFAADPLGWYTGGTTAVPDPDDIGTLTLVKADGTAVTSGTTDQPLAAYAVASGTVRTGDTSGSLFIHRPSSTTAAGAWGGEQASGTTRFAGTGAASAPTGVGSKPFVALAGSLPLSDVAAAYPADDSDGGFKNVYELRLRTSAAGAGVSTQYASAYVKVDGSSWKITTAPKAGGSAATITPAWASRLTYGTATTLPVTVAAGADPAKGSVDLKDGSSTVASSPLVDGKASLSIGRTALSPGKHTLSVTFTPSDESVQSGSVSKAYTVAKASPTKVGYRTTRTPTSRKTGAANVGVTVASGLPDAGGTADVVIKRGGTTKRIKGVKIKNGKASVRLPKLSKGTWKVTVAYRGDARYGARSSAATTLKIRK